MTITKNHNSYFTALCTLAGLETPVEHCCYFELMSQLYMTPFRWSVEYDDNRANDGVMLREKYMENDELDEDEPCNLLEMLVALARRCEDDLMYNPRFGNRSVDWFWMMLTNLGLNKFRDNSFEEAWNYTNVTKIVDKFMDREYNSKGVGGLFPLRGPCKNQINVELWYQLGTYIQEHPELG